MILVGILSLLLGACLENAGITLQKLAHVPVSHRPYYFRRQWIIGFLSYIGGTMFNAFALGVLPLALFASFIPARILINTA